MQAARSYPNPFRLPLRGQRTPADEKSPGAACRNSSKSPDNCNAVVMGLRISMTDRNRSMKVQATPI
jgi:hypothetical protein